jgi:uridylate kinase
VPSDPSPTYKRVLLKLSGEALMGDQQFGVDPAVATQIAQDVAAIQALGVETAIVIGGGNIFRGLAASAPRNGPRDRRLHGHARDGHQRSCAAGRARAARSCRRASSPPSRCARWRALHPPARDPASRKEAGGHLRGGTGNPYFTTDTAAALRAMEIKAEVILKGTKVDGIYTADPMLDPWRTKYPTISYLQVLERQLKVMDATAISLCMDNKLPIVVFNLREPATFAGGDGRSDRNDGVVTLWVNRVGIRAESPALRRR